MRWGIALSIFFTTTIAFGAPPSTKRCITAAEAGQAQRRAGHLMESRKSFVSCTQPECPAVVRKDCAHWVEELETALPTIVLKPQDEDGNDATGGKVTLDGDVAESTSRAITVDPGNHHIEWVRDEGTISVDVVVREGEHNRIVELRPKKKDTPKPPGETPPAPQPRSLTPFVVGGLGVVAAGVGGALWVIGLHDRSDLVDGCARTRSCTDDQIDSSKRKLIIGDVMFGVGVVAVAAAIYLFVTDTPSARVTNTAVLRW